MTASNRVVDLQAERARRRDARWPALEAELEEVPDPLATGGRLRYFPLPPVFARPDPRVCGDCGVGGGRHTADCPRWNQPAVEPVLALVPALVLGPVQLTLDDGAC